MYLLIIGNGAMGKRVEKIAREDGFFDKIEVIDPLDRNGWPVEKADLLIDFSHPKAIKDIYEYCRAAGGNIPVVIGTTGQTEEEETVLELLDKICPVMRKTNFSRGVEAMNEVAKTVANLLYGSDVNVEEIHHTKKKDAPSGTAKTLCDLVGIPYEKAVSIRMGTIAGQHSVFFALEDEILEIKHTAFSKDIFARGALEKGKDMLKAKKDN